MLKLLIRLFSIVFISFLLTNTASSLQFYDETISYFDNSKKISNSNNDWKFLSDEVTKNEKSSLRALDEKSFDWKHYENPSSLQFWDSGGDFIPSLPWRQLATNPSEENIKKYIEWQNKKLKLSSDLQQKIASYTPHETISLNTNEEKNIAIKKNKNSSINWSDFEIAYFYQTACSYCQKSQPLFAFLNKNGAKIIPIQLDWDRNPPIYKNSIKYDENLDKKFKINSTPVWIIKSKKGGSTRINGFASLEQLSEQVGTL